MEYILKLFDVELMKFRIIENLADPVLQITWINEKKKHLLPLGMELSDKGIASWMKNRTIPKNRAYAWSSSRYTELPSTGSSGRTERTGWPLKTAPWARTVLSSGEDHTPSRSAYALRVMKGAK